MCMCGNWANMHAQCICNARHSWYPPTKVISLTPSYINTSYMPASSLIKSYSCIMIQVRGGKENAQGKVREHGHGDCHRALGTLLSNFGKLLLEECNLMKWVNKAIKGLRDEVFEQLGIGGTGGIRIICYIWCSTVKPWTSTDVELTRFVQSRRYKYSVVQTSVREVKGIDRRRYKS